MSHDTRKDEQIAAMTDAILANQTSDTATHDQELGEVVLALQKLIEPSERPPLALEDRLKLALNKEWQTRAAVSQTGGLPKRYLMAAAGIAAVFVAIIALSLSTQVTGDTIIGTAVGGTPDSSLVVLFSTVGLVFVGALIYAFWRRR
ncbi:MAG: hypothetical protein IAE89_00885 [Anaerolineae bacterium]|nr:hypothetical protein [Anaerolineae bacterium]